MRLSSKRLEMLTRHVRDCVEKKHSGMSQISVQTLPWDVLVSWSCPLNSRLSVCVAPVNENIVSKAVNVTIHFIAETINWF